MIPPADVKAAPEGTVKTAAFFDLDGTLLTANSAALWMKRERRHGRLTNWQMAQGAFYLLAYKIGFIDMDEVTVKALETVKGLEEETVRKWTHDWFEAEVTPHVAAGGLTTLENHRSQGHMLVLLTSASKYESEVAIRHLNMDAFLCTRYEVRDGLFTGDVVRPVCFGAGKVLHATRFAEEHDIDLTSSYFYTDSITDLPMLLSVGHPRAVAPDFRLRLEARRHGWPVLNWKS
jgi:putative phosphoserine phosphatase/1-acylglycerol-3-phosphate O-acyltransferase